MSLLTLCRTCLTGNVNVFSITNTPIQEIYEKLTNCELHSKDGRPETVCYLCHAQMERWRRFRAKSRKSDKILTELLLNGIQIVQETIAILQKQIPQVFITTPVEAMTCSMADIHRPLPINDNNDTKATVKLENLAGNYVKKNLDREPQDLHNATICRICLSAVARTRTIISTSLQMVYEKLTDTKLVTGDKRPTSVCYICRWLLIKCRKFILKANKCNNILTELFHNGVQLTEGTVALLNNHIKTGFVVTPMKLFTYINAPDVKFKDDIIELDGHNDVEEDASPGFRELTLDEHRKTVAHEISGTKIWECNKCSYSCHTETLLNKHKRFHDPKRKFTCKKCYYRFDMLGTLKRHQKIVHTLKHKCNKCLKEFPNSNKLNMHKLTHGNNYFACEVCTKVFANRASLRSHNNKNHPNAKHPCGKCNVVFATSQYLRDHELKIHTRHLIYICDLCGSTSKSKANMGKHMKFVHTERERLECDQCGKKTPSKTTMIAHLGSHGLTKQLKCHLCSRLFNTSSSLSIHKKNHNKFSCKVCGSAFKFKIDLLTHVKIHPELACDICHEFTDDLVKHKIIHKGGIVVKCHFCDMKMGKKYLGVHLRTHTGEKPYCCDVCPKRFSRSTHLENHKAIHTGEKKKSCDICDMTFIQVAQLQRHLQTHTGIKPYVCMYCEKKFSEKRSLRYHINIAHTKNKMMCICDMCHKVHTNKEQLIQHITSHKGKKHPFSCSVCRKAFKTLILMCHHIKTHKIKQWPCTMCDYKFGKSSINRHYQIKHGVHAYACNICEEGTNEVSALISHMKSHNTVSYLCQICGNTFAYGRGLIKHLRNVHKLEPKKPYTQYYSIDRN